MNDGEATFEDGYTWEQAVNDPDNQLKTVFNHGKMVEEYTLQEVRANLNGGKF